MDNQATRLRRAREKAGYGSASSAASALDINASGYRHHENGTREYDKHAARKYARAFKVTPEWLMYGRNTGKRQINVVGYIGAGAEFNFMDDHAQGAGLDTVDAPDDCGKDAVAVIVRGSSMYPVYKDQDIIIYDEKTEDVGPFVGQECICWLADGRILVKTIASTSGGFYSLTSFNSPPIDGVVIESVAKIKWVKKR